MGRQLHTESTKKEDNHMTNRSTFEIVRKDGRPSLVLEGISQYVVDETLVIFYGINSETGHQELIQALHVDTVDSFRPVPEQEKVITPKHLYRIALTDGGTKDVRADLYRIATQGETQVYEFFSRVSVRETREELTIPAVGVRFVERVDEAATAESTRSVKPENNDVPESVDYVEAVRPKRH
jgi:hypothetical protein